ncbi:MAG: aspartate aminotransferase [Bacteroidota bacterium]|nr:aspartate aminotransferase [Bacteroidota bacterium]
MKYKRMPIEVESPEEMGYDTIQFNLAESSVRDIYFRDLKINLDDVFICYGEHRGKKDLREEIIRDEKNLSEGDVLVCPSAATALFIVSTIMLNKDDHLIVLRPNYATNIETPKAIGCDISYIDLSFENEFQFDIQQIKDAIQPQTKLISITSPHNPTGIIFKDELIKEIISIAEEKNIFVLVDETYRYLNFQTELIPYYASFSDHVISVCSLSKAFGVPGIRVGWLICKHRKLQIDLLAAKEQIIITNSVIDEEIALHILKNAQQFLSPSHQHIQQNFSVLKNWMENEQKYFEWIEPKAGVVCFPRIKKQFAIDTAKFYAVLYEKYKTLVGAGHWFEQDDRYMRIGFGYPNEEELQQGLRNLANCIKESIT